MEPHRRARIAALPRLLLTALAALCLLACACASSALASPAAKAGSSHASAPAHKGKHHRRGHRVKCAKRSSFHSAGGRPHHSKRHANKRRAKCHKRHSHVKARHHAKRRATARPPAASHNSSCPDADLRPNQDNLELVRAASLCLVNRERTTRGESPLQADGHLQQSAQVHSEDMAAGDYLDHNGRRGDTPLARMRATGYVFSTHIGFEVGENIGWGTLWMASPRSMVASWMGSSGHRANVLDPRFRDTGVGISPHPLSSLARGQAGAIYTQDFGIIITP